MVTLSIKTDFKDVQNNLKRLSDDMQKKVIPAALNKVLAKANTSMVREITSEFNMKSADVRTSIKQIKAKKSMAKWYAVLSGNTGSRTGRGFNLIRFMEKSISLAEGRRRLKSGNRNQLRVQIKKTGGKKVLQGAFIGNDGRTVFMRTGDARLPIKALTTIDVAQMFNTKRINSKVIQRINAEMAVEFDRAINAALRGNIR